MDAIRFPCTGCGKTIKVAAVFAGRRGSCPGCGVKFSVPSRSDSPPTDLSSRSNLSCGTNRRTNRPASNFYKVAALILQILLIGAVLILIGWRILAESMRTPAGPLAKLDDMIKATTRLAPSPQEPTRPPSPRPSQAGGQSPIPVLEPSRASAVSDLDSSSFRVPLPHVKIQPAANVDERLFLFRVLEGMYESWPADVTDPRRFSEAVADARFTALRFERYINDHNLGKELASLFGDYIQSLDAYTDFLASIGKIEARAVEQANTDRFNSGFDAGFNGGTTYAFAKEGGAESADAAGAALVVGLINYFAEEYQKDQERDAAKQEAVDHAARNVRDQIMGSLGRALNIAAEWTEKYGWRKGEAGFEIDAEESEQVKQIIAKGDRVALQKVAEEKTRLRPRDPIVRTTRNYLDSLNPGLDASRVLSLAEDTVRAASLVPAGSIYDDYRGYCLVVAAAEAADARQREIAADVDPLGSSALGQYSVAIWNTVQDFDSKDSSGEIREQRAWAYMANNQLQEAGALVNEVLDLRKNDMFFSYKYACLCSRAGDYDRSYDWLRQSMQQGFHDIHRVEKEWDLLGLRADQPTKYTDLTTVKITWAYVPGIINDDIVLTNNSAFTITDVVLNARLEANGKVWTPQLKADAIKPGETYKWSKVVSIPGSRADGLSATLNCDQDRLNIWQGQRINSFGKRLGRATSG